MYLTVKCLLNNDAPILFYRHHTPFAIMLLYAESMVEVDENVAYGVIPSRVLAPVLPLIVHDFDIRNLPSTSLSIRSLRPP